MIYMFLADGFEEIEALCPLDLLRRANLEIKTVSVTGRKTIVGSHGIAVEADILPTSDISFADAEMIIFPGGRAGAELMDAAPITDKAIDAALRNDAYICAICAAPMILGKRGLLSGKRAVCYPGFEIHLGGATYCPDDGVVSDGKIITSRAMGSSFEFGFALVSVMTSAQTAATIKEQIHF
jgi:Putative intracellular protease/amidase